MKTEYRYQVGEVVNETLKIISQTRYGKQNRKAYEVQSLVYPDAPTYVVIESKLVAGKGCAYKYGNRIYEGNSLYSLTHIRPYIVNIEESKKLAKNSRKKVIFKCPDCSKERYIAVKQVTYQGFSCPICSKGTSYPELFMLGYLEVKKIAYDYQKTFKTLGNRRLDFYIPSMSIVIEMHGRQHYYDKGTMFNHRETIKSDKEKKDYCIANKLFYIEIDSSICTFQSIKENVNNSMLPSITKTEEELILSHIEKNKRYPVKHIISLYRGGYSALEIGKKFQLSNDIVLDVLKKNNINIINKTSYANRGNHIYSRKVICTNTREVFDCIADANETYSISTGSISRVCQGKRKSAGKNPETGEPLRWEYVD